MIPEHHFDKSRLSEPDSEPRNIHMNETLNNQRVINTRVTLEEVAMQVHRAIQIFETGKNRKVIQSS